MGIILLLVLQVTTAVIVATHVAKPQNILGTHLAQAVIPDQPPSGYVTPPEATSTDQTVYSTPSDAATSEPAETPSPASEQTTTPFSTSSSDYPQDLTTSPEPQATPENLSPGPSGQELYPGNPSTQAPEPSAQTNVGELTDNQSTAVLNPDEILTSPESLSEKLQEQTKKEEDSLSQAFSPLQQNELLLSFVQGKISSINQEVKNDDFAAINFNAQGLVVQVDTVQENLQKLNLTEAAKQRQQLTSFCKKADFTLRSVELVVPEESEQDLEIARATCLNATL